MTLRPLHPFGHRGCVRGVVGCDALARPEKGGAASRPNEARVLERADLAQPAARADADPLETAKARAAEVARGQRRHIEHEIDPHAARQATQRHARVQRRADLRQ